MMSKKFLSIILLISMTYLFFWLKNRIEYDIHLSDSVTIGVHEALSTEFKKYNRTALNTVVDSGEEQFLYNVNDGHIRDILISFEDRKVVGFLVVYSEIGDVHPDVSMSVSGNLFHQDYVMDIGSRLSGSNKDVTFSWGKNQSNEHTLTFFSWSDDRGYLLFD